MSFSSFSSRPFVEVNSAFFACVSVNCTVTWFSSGNRDTDISVAGRIPLSRAWSTSCNTCTRCRSSCTCATDCRLDSLQAKSQRSISKDRNDRLARRAPIPVRADSSYVLSFSTSTVKRRKINRQNKSVVRSRRRGPPAVLDKAGKRQGSQVDNRGCD